MRTKAKYIHSPDHFEPLFNVEHFLFERMSLYSHFNETYYLTEVSISCLVFLDKKKTVSTETFLSLTFLLSN